MPDASEVDREILAGNRHGVDLNPEPVEITKLSLWLKTAKRGKLLQDLGQSKSGVRVPDCWCSP